MRDGQKTPLGFKVKLLARKNNYQKRRTVIPERNNARAKLHVHILGTIS